MKCAVTLLTLLALGLAVVHADGPTREECLARCQEAAVQAYEGCTSQIVRARCGTVYGTVLYECSKQCPASAPSVAP